MRARELGDAVGALQSQMHEILLLPRVAIGSVDERQHIAQPLGRIEDRCGYCRVTRE